jgi:lipoprotein-releasing system permease protein
MVGVFIAAAVIALLVGALIAAHVMYPYAFPVGWRYLRSKKRGTVSIITGIAVIGVMNGVGALLSVLSITSGFQEEFRNKVLGVNAHVLVLKYGLDFEEYRDVVERAREMPEVAGAAPFLINEMMLARGDRISGVLVKGVDPSLMPTVLDLPDQMIQGGLDGLRVPGAAPPTRPEDLMAPVDDDWDWLDDLARQDGGVREIPDGGVEEQLPELPPDIPPEQPAQEDDADAGVVVLPEVDVPTPEQAEDSMQNNDGANLPNDALLDQFLREQDLLAEEDQTGETPVDRLPGIIVGATLARTLGIGVGDRVKVVSPLAGLDISMLGGSANTTRSRDFRVIGIFEAGFQEYDSRLVYVDLFEAQRFFDNGDSVTGVEIRLHDLDAATNVSRRLERVLGGGPYHTMDWQELNRNLFTALEIQKIMLSLVIGLIIIIAAFNVIATLIMVVLEKKREIAIMKAMGARNFGVLLIFMVQGLVIGLVGTVLGLALGGGVVWYLERFRFPLDPHVYLIDHLPVRTSAVEFVVTIAIALGISIIATIIPSAWAARLLPAEGVRYE